MLNKNTHSSSWQASFLITSFILLLSGCTHFNQKKELLQPQYQLDANLIIDERPLEPQTAQLAAGQRATLYFEDSEKSQLYKVFYFLKAGEQEGTVEIFTSVNTEVTAPSFLTYEGEEASAIFPPKVPMIEVKVKATPVKPTLP
ncbi:hypothetical protein [Endozoicomonas arenosclerae]|uniref:hypothetical protein n=1 Tax=Endozoicomonas arenosclerae TaxID=1633495 RepID=UPI0007807466|nr:hypothetical protein [Endozoicomonas arenosclerae]